MPIAGSWRSGRSESSGDDTDPYTGDVLTTIQLANQDDVNEAFESAKTAQRDWANMLPTHLRKRDYPRAC
jgi:aldehyde dehydrogenase (NAD+)